MDDSPRNDRLGRRSAIVAGLLQGIEGCDVFREALQAFERASEDVHARREEGSLRDAAAPALDRAAWALVAAAADYYCAHTVFDICAALDDGDGGEA
jgi:hypothetical protein